MYLCVVTQLKPDVHVNYYDVLIHYNCAVCTTDVHRCAYNNRVTASQAKNAIDPSLTTYMRDARTIHTRSRGVQYLMSSRSSSSTVCRILGI